MPIFATPLGTAFLFVCDVPVCAMTTPLLVNTLAKNSSVPNLSSSENSIGKTITPAPACLSLRITSAILSLDHGHCPYFSMDFSSIVTIPMSDDKLVSSCCINISKDFNFNISLTYGSCKP